MDKKGTYRGAALAAVLAFIAVLIMGFGVPLPEAGIELQPSLSFGPVSEFVYPINTYPAEALRFFAADSLFVLSYMMVFVGLSAVVGERSRVFAGLGLGAGILTAFFDASENAYFITYAASALKGVPLEEPALPLIYVFANLKWMAAFAALYAFGLMWPREGALAWIISLLMLLFPIVGVLGVASPGLIAWRGLFFLLGMPLFAWSLWRRAQT